MLLFLCVSGCGTDKEASVPGKEWVLPVYRPTECKMAQSVRQPAFTILSFQRHACTEYAKHCVQVL